MNKMKPAVEKMIAANQEALDRIIQMPDWADSGRSWQSDYEESKSEQSDYEEAKRRSLLDNPSTIKQDFEKKNQQKNEPSENLLEEQKLPVKLINIDTEGSEENQMA